MFITFFIFIIIIIILKYFNCNRMYTYIVKPVIINRPTSKSFKNSVNGNRIIIFTDVLYNTNIKQLYSDKTRQMEVIKFFRNFHLWNTHIYKFKMLFENKNEFSDIKIVMNDLYLKTILNGSKKILVFNKTYKTELQKYINRDLNIWKDDTIKTQFDYVQLTLTKGDMIYIPNGWLYAEYNITNTVSIEKEADTLLRPVINKWVKDN